MLDKIRSLSGSRFVRNVAIVATGTASAQLITIAFSPIITRLYGPEAFGVLGVFMAALGILIPISAMTYPAAIVLPVSDGEAKVLSRVSSFVAGLLSVSLALILLVASDHIAGALGLETISEYLFLIPVAMFFAAMQQTLTQWLMRKGLYGVTSKVAILRAIVVNFLKAGFGLVKPYGVTLILLAVAGQALHAAMLYFGVKSKAPAKQDLNSPVLPAVKAAAKYSDFPIYRAPQVLLSALSLNLPVLVLGGFFGPIAAGYFALTKSVLAAPAGLIGQSVGSVFYPKAAEMHQSGLELKKLLIKSTFLLFIIGAVIFTPVLMVGEWLFSVVFGAEWREAGEYARWVGVWMVFSLAARPTVAIIPVVGLQKLYLILEALFLPIKILGLLCGVLISSAEMAVLFFSVVSCFLYTLLFVCVMRKVC